MIQSPFVARTLYCLAVIAIGLIPQSGSADDYELGRSAANEGNYAEAYFYWKPMADKGHGRASFNIGRMYARGDGVKKDFKKARQYFESAAQAGESEAAEKLGHMFFYGDGIPRDLGLAKRWYDRALQLKGEASPAPKNQIEAAPGIPVASQSEQRVPPVADRYDFPSSSIPGKDLSSSGVTDPPQSEYIPPSRPVVAQGSGQDVIVYSDGGGSPNPTACFIATEQTLRSATKMARISKMLEEIVGQKLVVKRCPAHLASYVLIEQELVGVPRIVTVQFLQDKISRGELARIETLRLQ